MSSTKNSPTGIPSKGQNFTFSLDTPSLSCGTLDNYVNSILGPQSASSIPELLKGTNLNHQPSHKFVDPPKNQETKQQNAESVVVANAIPENSSNLSQDNNVSSSEITTSNLTDIIPMPRGQSYVDITEYLNMPQSEAAKKLGIPPSTLSKRWKEAVRKRKWPYRMICKIDKEIMTLLHNVPQGPNAPPLPEEIESALGALLRKRQEELRSVIIRL